MRIGCGPTVVGRGAPSPSQDLAPTAGGAKADTDWPIFRGDSQATGVARSTLPDRLELLWRFTVPKGAFEGTPAIVDGVVYLGDLDGKLYALDLATGKQRWVQTFEGGFTASPSVRDGLLYLGDYDGRFYCVRTEDGQLVWQHEAQAEIDGSANFFEDRVLFGSQDATLYCLKAKTGELVWKHTVEDQIRCSPTIVEGRCFVAGCDGLLHIINVRDGQPMATVPSARRRA
jgi:outer membrane protein assembly factor BamB